MGGALPGKRPHFEMLDVFDTTENARNWIDPHIERVWERPEAGAAGIVRFHVRTKRAPSRRDFRLGSKHGRESYRRG